MSAGAVLPSVGVESRPDSIAVLGMSMTPIGTYAENGWIRILAASATVSELGETILEAGKTTAKLKDRPTRGQLPTAYAHMGFKSRPAYMRGLRFVLVEWVDRNAGIAAYAMRRSGQSFLIPNPPLVFEVNWPEPVRLGKAVRSAIEACE